MPQIFHPRANGLTSLLLTGIPLVVIAVAVTLVLLDRSSYATGVGITPLQPVPFSHQHHVGALGIDCGYCHTTVGRSPFAGLPDTHTCMSCHSQVWTKAEMLAPVRQSLAEDRPLTWWRVHDLADFVYFDHRAHVNNGVGCEACHGRVDKMPLLRQTAPLTMKWCLECHRDPAPNLRPEGEITTMGYEPGPEVSGTALMAHYGIDKKRLSECITCHR